MKKNNEKKETRKWITLYDKITLMVLGVYFAKDEAEARAMWKAEQIFEA